MITAQNFFMLTGTTLGAVKVVSDVTGHKPGPLTGYQYTQAGGQHLDDTKKLLSQKRGVTPDAYVLSAKERADYCGDHDRLVVERQDLELQTNSYRGSFEKRRNAKEFYEKAHALSVAALAASDRSMNAYYKSEAEAELRESSNRYSRPLQDSGKASPSKENTARVDLYPPLQSGQGSHVNFQFEQVQCPPNAARGHRLYAQPAQYSGNPGALQPLAPGVQTGGPRQYGNGKSLV